MPIRKTLLLTVALVSTVAISQTPPQVATEPVAFDVATIKPPDPTAHYRRIGFYGEPGGRVHLGASVKMIVEYAYRTTLW